MRCERSSTLASSDVERARAIGSRLSDEADYRTVTQRAQVLILYGNIPADKKGPDAEKDVRPVPSDGAPLGVRTLDLGIKSPLLYQLS